MECLTSSKVDGIFGDIPIDSVQSSNATTTWHFSLHRIKFEKNLCSISTVDSSIDCYSFLCYPSVKHVSREGTKVVFVNLNTCSVRQGFYYFTSSESSLFLFWLNQRNITMSFSTHLYVGLLIILSCFWIYFHVIFQSETRWQCHHFISSLLLCVWLHIARIRPSPHTSTLALLAG